MDVRLPVVAGVISTILFATSTLPMVLKAYRTKDLKSYSFGYLLLGNAGNLFYSIYVYDMPPGPIWFLHTFYLVTAGLMLFWYLRYEGLPNLQQTKRHLHTMSERASLLIRKIQAAIHEPKSPVELPH